MSLLSLTNRIKNLPWKKDPIQELVEKGEKQSEFYEKIMKDHQNFLAHCEYVRHRAGVGKHARSSIENGCMEKYGVIQINGVFVLKRNRDEFIKHISNIDAQAKEEKESK